jgi:hypothetical protein
MINTRERFFASFGTTQDENQSRMLNITDGVKKLLGNTKGPTSKMA